MTPTTPTPTPAELDALVDRLRKYGEAAENPRLVADYSERLAIKAASALTALRADNARLQQALADERALADRREADLMASLQYCLTYYDMDNPMQTADVHVSDCHCRRCVMDGVREALAAHSHRKEIE